MMTVPLMAYGRTAAIVLLLGMSGSWAVECRAEKLCLGFSVGTTQAIYSGAKSGQLSVRVLLTMGSSFGQY